MLGNVVIILSAEFVKFDYVLVGYIQPMIRKHILKEARYL